MARQSSAALAVVQTERTVMERLPPPEDLLPDEAVLWCRVVDTKPADWFQDDSAALLKEYVRAWRMCDLLSQRVEVALVGDDLGLLKEILKLRDIESKRLLSTGTKLRLTQQSRYTPRASVTANNKVGSARPWAQ